MRNLYDILGIAQDSDAAAIRKAYKQLVKKYHPDLNPDPSSKEKFKEVTQAYEVLGDEERRQLYDQYGDVALNDKFKGFENGPSWESGVGGFSDFDQFFNSYTSGMGNGTQQYRGSEGYSSSQQRRRQSQSRNYGGSGTFSDFGYGSRHRSRQSAEEYQPPERGTHIKVSITLSLVEAIQGCSKRIKLRRPSRWSRGSNAGMQQEMVTADIPPGVQSGAEIKMKGKGNPGKGGGAPGDLLVQITVNTHPHLYREGANLYFNIPLTLKEALTGAQIVVPTLDGSVRVRVPPGVTSGQKLRLKGRGGPKQSGGNGDMYLILRPTPPTSSDPKVLELAEELEMFYTPAGIRHDLKL